MLGEPENQFSRSRGARSAGERAESKFLLSALSFVGGPSPKACLCPARVEGEKVFKGFLLLAVSVSLAATAHAQTWTPLSYPGARSTSAYGVSGNKVVGFYEDSSSHSRGFLYNGGSWTPLDYPGAAQTLPIGISGNRIVGEYYDVSGNTHGFLYDGTQWSMLDYPGLPTSLHGIDGNNIVGSIWMNNSWRGVRYDGVSWTVLNYPQSMETSIRGISGSNLVGTYSDGNGASHGFLYDGTTWTRLDYPGGSSNEAHGISGGTIVGTCWYSGWDGLIYNGTNWTRMDYPGAWYTRFLGIDGNTIVGDYQGDNTGWLSQGFILTIPEPTTLSLLALGWLAVITRRAR